MHGIHPLSLYVALEEEYGARSITLWRSQMVTSDINYYSMQMLYTTEFRLLVDHDPLCSKSFHINV